MSHFAKVNNGIVTKVIVAEQDFIDSYNDSDEGVWIQTSINTCGGVHLGQDGKPDGGIALRGNFAGVGYIYDSQRDVFIPPKPFESWVLNETTCLWDAPVAMPSDVGTGEPPKRYTWDEATTNWVAV
jgi:hypothetical protein